MEEDSAGIVLWFYPEVTRRDQMAQNLLEHREELAALQSLRKQREREVYLLENDKEYIETIARDKLDTMKEGETIFRLDPGKDCKAGAKTAMIDELEAIDTSAISARLAELRRFL